jgi:hypothetical protein
MTIEEIKQILTNKLNELQSRKNLAYMSGDLATYASLDTEIVETQATIDKLND